ncbi:phosphoribosylaminoimidazolesuccinocarboxamide synthase, partial [Burkholderia sp. SG-MS1]|uniref:phosphoribosylaminoimidazolesuccinocarboxamide synthase n=1 Tax=Paraburkholderia sp. SG-MS1 TaxID=2023741 RepID=UPI00144762F7
GVELPPGLQNAQKLPEPIFTPAAKAEMGHHDENITYDEMERRIGTELSATIRDISIKLYKEAADYAATRGIIIADTKFEFGLDNHGKLYLMDEALTADSSRFWPADQYQVGTNPPSFDKQFVRDWLETQPWKKEPPAPKLPDDVVRKTGEKYQEALERLTGHKLA